MDRMPMPLIAWFASGPYTTAAPRQRPVIRRPIGLRSSPARRRVSPAHGTRNNMPHDGSFTRKPIARSEALEPRRLLSSAVRTGDILRVNGDAGVNDVITIGY